MPNSVPPSGSTPPSDPTQGVSPSPPPSPPPSAKGSTETMTEFMKLFTPDQLKKFMNILIQNLTREMQKASKKYIDELKKEREDIENQA